MKRFLISKTLILLVSLSFGQTEDLALTFPSQDIDSLNTLVISGEYCDSIVESQEATIQAQREKIDLQGISIAAYGRKIATAEGLLENRALLIGNKDKEIASLKKKNKQLKFHRLVLGIVSAALAVLGAVR